MRKKTNVGSRKVEPFQVQNPKPVLIDSALYEGDGGHLFCGKHAGMSARFSGRDLSGQRVHRYSERDCQAFEAEIGEPPGCDTCGLEWRKGPAATLPIQSGGVVLVEWFAVNDRASTKIWRDEARRACWDNGSRVTEDQVDRLPCGEALRALVIRERLTVLGFASEDAAERGDESEIQLWSVEL